MTCIASLTTYMSLYHVFQVACSSQNQNAKNRDLNPPREAKIPHANLDSIGGFKSHDLLPFCIPILVSASNLKNSTVSTAGKSQHEVHVYISAILLFFHTIIGQKFLWQIMWIQEPNMQCPRNWNKTARVICMIKYLLCWSV